MTLSEGASTNAINNYDNIPLGQIAMDYAVYVGVDVEEPPYDKVGDQFGNEFPEKSSAPTGRCSIRIPRPNAHQLLAGRLPACQYY